LMRIVDKKNSYLLQVNTQQVSDFDGKK